MTQYFKNPILSGISLKCGRCGQGKLFRTYLKFRLRCEHCNQDFSVADTADGPAFFVGFLAAIIFTPFVMMVGFLVNSPIGMIVGYTLVLAGCILFCLILLPLFKGVLFNLQIQHSAQEGKFISTGTHGKAPRNWKK